MAMNRIQSMPRSGCCDAFDLRKYVSRYLAVFCYRFNRRLGLRSLHRRPLAAAVAITTQSVRSIRVADAHC